VVLASGGTVAISALRPGTQVLAGALDENRVLNVDERTDVCTALERMVAMLPEADEHIDR
jgi:hypothetical protein